MLSELEIRLLILFVLPITAIFGYWFMSVWNYSRFSVKLESGYHLFYKSTFFGCIVLFILFCIFWILSYMQQKFFLFDGVFNIFVSELVAGYITMILGIFSPYLLNYFFFKDKLRYLERAMRNCGNSLYLLILESSEARFFIELTLTNGKILVGVPSEPSNVRYEYVDIITHDNRHRISIQAKEILTARRFDPSV